MNMFISDLCCVWSTFWILHLKMRVIENNKKTKWILDYICLTIHFGRKIYLEPKYLNKYLDWWCSYPCILCMNLKHQENAWSSLRDFLWLNNLWLLQRPCNSVSLSQVSSSTSPGHHMYYSTHPKWIFRSTNVHKTLS